MFPPTIRNMWAEIATESELQDFIQQAKRAYYNNETPLLVSDEEYDRVEEIYIQRFGKTPTVGAPPPPALKGSTAVLPVWMGSLDKVKTDTELAAFRTRSQPCMAFTVTAKLDGVSALYTSEGRLYTRGNGRTGTDITHLKEKLGLPPPMSGYHVRGEIVNDRKGGRQDVVGIVNAKHKTSDEPIRFVAYEMIPANGSLPGLPHSLQLERMRGHDGLEVVRSVVTPMDATTLGVVLDKMRDVYPCDVDGLVITADCVTTERNESGNPSYAVAFKKNAVFSETVVEEVEWNETKDGILMPRVRFALCMMGRSSVRFATGFNARYIVSSGIGPGAVIRIVMSGDVIPHIDAVIVRVDGRASFPEEETYEWDENRVHIRVLATGKTGVIQALRHFVKTLGVKDGDEGMLAKLYEEEGVRDIDGLVLLLSRSGSFGHSVMKFMKGLSEKLYHAEPSVLMAATGFFGRGVGVKKLRALLETLPDMRVWNVEKIRAVPGFEEKTARKVVQGMEPLLRFTEKHGIPIMMLSRMSSRKIPMFEGKTVVLTGFRDEELESLIRDSGGRVATSISSSTDMVVAADPDGSGSKLRKARSLDIRIIARDEVS
jgi:NAD-dependent DNA ligase